MEVELKGLSNQDFAEYIKPLREIDERLMVSKTLLINHIDQSISLNNLNIGLTEKQNDEYFKLCENLGRNLLKLFETIEDSHKQLENLKNQ